MIVQKIRCLPKDPYEKATRYFSILSAVNGLSLTERDIQLVSFMAVYKEKDLRKEFCNRFETTMATTSNIVHKMRKRGLIVKDGTGIALNPNFPKDFTQEITLTIFLTNG